MRAAVYAAPGTPSVHAGAARLRTLAEQWLGRSATGDPVEAATPLGHSRSSIDAITRDARRYGFHGTLKAPFRLARGHSLDELDGAVARFAARRPLVVLPSLTLARIDGFFALVPGVPAPRLDAIANDVVVKFDRFRAPLSDADRSRRDPAALTERQQELLDTYGYPYVLEEFRFHLTLTDRVPPGQQPEVERMLRSWFDEVLGHDVPVDALAVFVEPEPGAPFVLHAAHRLHPTLTSRTAEAPASEGTR